MRIPLVRDLTNENGAGDWAGDSYATSGCPGTCEERLLDPSNFVVRSRQTITRRYSHPIQNATWIINHLLVYKKQVLNGQVGNNGSSANLFMPSVFTSIFTLSLLFGVAAGLLL